MVIFEYLDHESTQFRMSASELLLFVSVVLVLINAPSGIPTRDDIVSLQLIYYDKKGHFQIYTTDVSTTRFIQRYDRRII